MIALKNKNEIQKLYITALQEIERVVKLFETIYKKDTVNNGHIQEFIKVLLIEKKELIQLISQKNYENNTKHFRTKHSYVHVKNEKKLFINTMALINKTIKKFRTVYKRGLIINVKVEPLSLFEDKILHVHRNALRIEIDRKNLFTIVCKNNPSQNKHLLDRIEELNEQIEELDEDISRIHKLKIDNRLGEMYNGLKI